MAVQEVIMDRKIEAFRQEALARRKGRGRGAARYAAAARDLACEYAAKARQQGRSWAEVSRELGLAPMTLRKWCGSKPQAQLVPVTVTAAAPIRGSCSIAVVTPGGLRIEGLDVQDVVALVRALG